MCMTNNGYLKGPALQQHIENCMIQMLKEMSYNAIRISDLCTRANVARKTFYSYYPTKDACFQAVAERIILNVMMYTNGHMKSTSNVLEYYTHYLNCWKNNRWFLEIVQKNDLDSHFIQRGMYLIQSVDSHFLGLLSTSTTAPDMDVLRSYVSCDFMLVLEWCARGFDTPVETMAQKYVRLLHQPFIPLSETQKMWPSST